MKKSSFIILIALVFFVSTSITLSGCHKENIDKGVSGEFSIPLNNDGNGLNDVRNTEITYIYTPSASIDLMFDASFKEVISKIQEHMLDKYLIKVNMEFLPNSNYYETVSKRLRSNDRIDVFSPHPSKYPNMETVQYNNQNYLQQWISEFEIADLTDYTSSFYPELNEHIINPDIREAVVFNDRIYGVPGILSNMQGNLQVLAIYKDYYESIDKPQIKTIDDLYQIIRSVRQSSYMNKGRIICSFEDFLSWHCGNNGYMYYSNLLAYQGKTILSLENEPVLQEAFNLYQDISDLVSERNIPFYWKGSWDVPGVNDIDTSDEMSFSPVLIQLSLYNQFYLKSISNTERFSNEYEIMFLNNPCTVTYDTYNLNYLINGASSNIKSALFFLRCLETDEEIYDLFRYGIKNNHYHLNDQGAVSYGKDVFLGWDYTDRLISKKLERPMAFELRAPNAVWEDYIQKSNHIINGINYKKLLRIHLDNDKFDSDLLRIFNNRVAVNLFKDLHNSNIHYRNTLTNVIKSGIEIEDFIRYYDSYETNALLKAIQGIIDKHIVTE